MHCQRTTVLGAILLCAASSHAGESERDAFLWGVANSAFQVEGTPADSDWKRWTRTPGKIADGSNADVATDFWNRYEEDIRLAKSAGLNAFRLSIAWERVEPTPGRWDHDALRHYGQIVSRITESGMEPILTLHHFVLPAWLAEQGGILAPDFAERFAAYSRVVVTFFLKSPFRVRTWMTFNEPMVLVRNSYLEGSWPPGKKDASLAMRAAASLAKAHVRAVTAIRELRSDLGPDLQIGIAQHWRVFESADYNPLSWLVAVFLDRLFNRSFVDAILSGKASFWMPGAARAQEDLGLSPRVRSLDYLGINYYGRTMTTFRWKPPFFEVSEGPGPKSDMGWEIFGEGLETAIRQAARFGLPVLVSENGIADAEDFLRRELFLKSHLDSLALACREKLPVFGYLHWSLTDNFEWSHGLKPRFGLVAIDYATRARKPRPSLKRYALLIREVSRDCRSGATKTAR